MAKLTKVEEEIVILHQVLTAKRHCGELKRKLSLLAPPYITTKAFTGTTGECGHTEIVPDHLPCQSTCWQNLTWKTLFLTPLPHRFGW